MRLAFADFKHGKVNIAGGQLHYRVGGAGEPVVLLHGWPQHSLQWHSVAPRLAERYQVVVPDLPACGGSSIPRAGYDKRTIAAKVRELVRQLNLGPVKLVGYDHGAGVAYNYACCAYVGDVSHLAIVEYVLPGCGYEKAMMPSPDWHIGSNWQLAFFTVPEVAEFAFRGRERELLTWFFWHGSCNPAAVIPAHLDEYVDQIAKPGALRAGIEYYAAVWQDIEINKENMQRKLAMPVLGIGGRCNAGEMVGKALAIVAERVGTAVVEGAGHWVSDELHPVRRPTTSSKNSTLRSARRSKPRRGPASCSAMATFPTTGTRPRPHLCFLPPAFNPACPAGRAGGEQQMIVFPPAFEAAPRPQPSAEPGAAILWQVGLHEDA